MRFSRILCFLTVPFAMLGVNGDRLSPEAPKAGV